MLNGADNHRSSIKSYAVGKVIMINAHHILFYGDQQVEYLTIKIRDILNTAAFEIFSR